MFLKLVYFNANGWYHSESVLQLEGELSRAIDFVRHYRDCGTLPGLPLGRIWGGVIQISVDDASADDMNYMPVRLLQPPLAGSIVTCHQCQEEVSLTEALFNQEDYFHEECLHEFYGLDDE